MNKDAVNFCGLISTSSELASSTAHIGHLISSERMGLGSSKPSSESVAETKGQADSSNQQVNNVDASGPAEAQENGHEGKQAGLQKRRMSFYETVDASEVLPYLIIGKF